MENPMIKMNYPSHTQVNQGIDHEYHLLQQKELPTLITMVLEVGLLLYVESISGLSLLLFSAIDRFKYIRHVLSIVYLLLFLLLVWQSFDPELIFQILHAFVTKLIDVQNENETPKEC